MLYTIIITIILSYIYHKLTPNQRIAVKIFMFIIFSMMAIVFFKLGVYDTIFTVFGAWLLLPWQLLVILVNAVFSL